MGSTIAAVVMVMALAAWHLKTRRHANWQFSAGARFYITAGYPLVAVAVYFLNTATSSTDWAWAFGNVWALLAMAAFAYGFDTLNAGQRPDHGGARVGKIANVSPRDARVHLAVTTSKRLLR